MSDKLKTAKAAIEKISSQDKELQKRAEAFMAGVEAYCLEKKALGASGLGAIAGGTAGATLGGLGTGLASLLAGDEEGKLRKMLIGAGLGGAGGAGLGYGLGSAGGATLDAFAQIAKSNPEAAQALREAIEGFTASGQELAGSLPAATQ